MKGAWRREVCTVKRGAWVHEPRAGGPQVYVFWNTAEREPGVYDFSGRFDVLQFLRDAQAAGLMVNLRIGPCVGTGHCLSAAPTRSGAHASPPYLRPRQPMQICVRRVVLRWDASMAAAHARHGVSRRRLAMGDGDGTLGHVCCRHDESGQHVRASGRSGDHGPGEAMGHCQ